MKPSSGGLFRHEYADKHLRLIARHQLSGIGRSNPRGLVRATAGADRFIRGGWNSVAIKLMVRRFG
jgi:hypothetical protein